MIFIPEEWPHAVVNLEDSIAVSYNFVDEWSLPNLVRYHATRAAAVDPRDTRPLSKPQHHAELAKKAIQLAGVPHPPSFCHFPLTRLHSVISLSHAPFPYLHLSIFNTCALSLSSSPLLPSVLVLSRALSSPAPNSFFNAYALSPTLSSLLFARIHALDAVPFSSLTQLRAVAASFSIFGPVLLLLLTKLMLL